MATTWTETAGEICTDALEHLSVLGGSETAAAADMNTALRGLNAVLKELPLSGYVWPKLSGEVALTWVSGQTITLPTDYYNYPMVWRTIAGQKVNLTQITHADWVRMPGRNTTGEPTHFYISPDAVLYLYPAPTVDPVATIQYQRLIPDAVAVSAPDIASFWISALGYGVADEIALKFGASQEKRIEISKRWSAKRAKALEASIVHMEIRFDVAD